MKPIFDYFDYRKYLSDYYHHQKAVTPHFSHRFFLAKAGMRGPNFLKNIIDGKKNLSQEGIKKFARALDLPARASHYFADLVMFNQTKSLTKKKNYYHRLARCLHNSNVRLLPQNQYEYFSHWYTIAVREYLHCHRFRDDYEALARSIRPKISVKQARKAVALLERLQLIARGDDGYYKLADTMVTTGPEVAGLGALEYHKSMLDLGKKALVSFPARERYMHGITGSFSGETFSKVKTVIDAARKQILELIDSDTGNRRVYHVGMQLFPLSSSGKGAPDEE